MRFRTMVLGIAVVAATSPALSAQAGSGESEPSAEQKALVANCAAHKFETRIIRGDRESRVRICGKPGQSDADWLETLRDSARKTEASTEMEAEVKSQLLAALKAEIEARAAALAGAPPAPQAPAIAEITIESPPLTPRESAPRYSSLPPMPTPKKVAPPVLGAKAAPLATPTPAIPAPRLTIRCGLPGEAYAECGELETQTRLSIRAGEAFADGTALRFLRNGKSRAEIDLAGMQPGETLSRKLPGAVCQGVMRGRVEFALVSKGQVAKRLGPYALRCGT